MALMSMSAIAIALGVAGSGGLVANQVFDAYVGNPGAGDKHAVNRVVFTEEFDLTRKRNFRVRLVHSHKNAWVGVNGAPAPFSTGAGSWSFLNDRRSLTPRLSPFDRVRHRHHAGEQEVDLRALGHLRRGAPIAAFRQVLAVDPGPR